MAETDILSLFEQLTAPAFLVKENQIVYANHAAQQRQFNQGDCITPYLGEYVEEYQNYEDGSLHLVLKQNESLFSACISCFQDYHLFILDSEYASTELSALATAAQQLRDPLSNAMTTAGTLITDANQEQIQQLQILTKNLYRLQRAILNMADAGTYSQKREKRVCLVDINQFLLELTEKVSTLAEATGIHLSFTQSQDFLFTYIDEEKLERGLLNLISNAMKFSAKDSHIEISLTQSPKKLYITVRDTGCGLSQSVKGNLFSRYLRQPGLEDARSGHGLGLTIARSAAIAHDGTLLATQNPEGGVSFTMSLAMITPKGGVLRSPIMFPVDYAGGHDHTLLELSDILPSSLYEP